MGSSTSLHYNLSRPECAIVFVGFQAAGTLGRRIVDGADTVRFLGEEHPVRAKVYTIGGLSAHADQAALLDWLGGFRRPPRATWVVHGEPLAAHALREAIEKRLGLARGGAFVRPDGGARERSVNHETVGQHMVARVARAREYETAAMVLARLVREQPGNVELVCVEATDGRLAGVLPIERLFAVPEATRMGDAMDPSFPRVTPDTDQEVAASMALDDAVDALPVVDGDGRLLGLMPSQALLQVLRQEHIEDIHLLAGIQRESAQARGAIEEAPLRGARHRLPWLLVGLVGAMIATAAMAGFESTLEAKVAVAFFVPGLVYIADAIGTQSEAIAVRGLSLTVADRPPARPRAPHWDADRGDVG